MGGVRREEKEGVVRKGGCGEEKEGVVRKRRVW